VRPGTNRTLLLAAALLLTGCTSDSAPVLRTGDPGAEPGGVLRVAITTPGTVDPGNVYEPAGDLVVRTLCAPLLATDPETSQVVPSIVSSYLVSDGGASLTLRLRDDVVFSDGTPLTAEDVAFSLSRIASAEFASTSAELLTPIDGYGEVHGDIPTDADLDRRRLRGVRVGDKSLQISLVQPLSDFVRLLTSPLLAPVSEQAAERDPDGFARNPLCVGPYQLDQPYAPGDDALRLVRSAAYTPVDSSLSRGGRSYADAIEFRFYGDAPAAAAAVAAGEADVAPARPQDTEGVQTGPGPAIEYLGLPAAAPGFEEPVVRRALALAVDRQELVQRLFPRSREPAEGFLPATAQAQDSCDGLPPGGDAAGARELLAGAGADLTGVRVPFYFNDELGNRELVAEVTRQLREAVGLTAVPMPMTFPEYLAKAATPQGFDGLFRFSWSVPHPSVDGYLHPLFSTDRIGRDNLSRFSDPDVDRAITRIARAAEDDQDRELGYAQVAELLCAAMPIVPLTTSLSRWLVSKEWTSAVGEAVDGSTGQVLLRELYQR